MVKNTSLGIDVKFIPSAFYIDTNCSKMGISPANPASLCAVCPHFYFIAEPR
jgi:hypothetical protein